MVSTELTEKTGKMGRMEYKVLWVYRALKATQVQKLLLE